MLRFSAPLGGGSLDVQIVAIARCQHGLVTTEQLTRLGLTSGAITHRVKTGRLVRIHQGVFALGTGQLSYQGHLMAAVLAIGTGSAISHSTAAGYWRMVERPSGAIHVSAPKRTGRMRRVGIRVHRPVSLTADEITVEDHIAVTTPARTLLDLAARVRGRPLRRALAKAERERIFDRHAIESVLNAHPRSPGAGALRRALAYLVPTDATRSELEDLFLELCERHGFPRPVTNAIVCGLEVDFYWPEHRVVVETDGRQDHDTASAFEEDRVRDATLTAAGFRVVRFTWIQVRRSPAFVERTLRALMPERSLP
jgi:predicted transcriptional regulator of viral defense system